MIWAGGGDIRLVRWVVVGGIGELIGWEVGEGHNIYTKIWY